MQTLPIKDGVQEYLLSSWQDMLALAEDLFAKAPAYIYRGQADWDWPIVSSLRRLQAKHPRRKNLSGSNPPFFDCPPFSEEEHLAAFRRAICGRRGATPPSLDEDECWALGQHHGLATPLIDWTRSPFMALFFAFEEERILRKDRLISPTDRAVFALSTSVFGDADGERGRELRFVSLSGDDNSRLVSQQGLLVALPSETDLEEYIRKTFPNETSRAILTKFRIPNKDRDACLNMLNKMGINHMTLFPDIRGAARHVNSLWQPGHEDSIAYI